MSIDGKWFGAIKMIVTPKKKKTEDKKYWPDETQKHTQQNRQTDTNTHTHIYTLHTQIKINFPLSAKNNNNKAKQTQFETETKIELKWKISKWKRSEYVHAKKKIYNNNRRKKTTKIFFARHDWSTRFYLYNMIVIRIFI